MDYTELDKATQRAQVKARIRDLEQQHFTLSLELRAPDRSATPNQEGAVTQITRLEASLAVLRETENDLQTS